MFTHLRFKKLNQPQPDPTHLVYIETLQKSYRALTKQKTDQLPDVTSLCTQIMQVSYEFIQPIKTPELAKQIGSALVHFFETNLP